MPTVLTWLLGPLGKAAMVLAVVAAIFVSGARWQAKRDDVKTLIAQRLAAEIKAEIAARDLDAAKQGESEATAQAADLKTEAAKLQGAYDAVIQNVRPGDCALHPDDVDRLRRIK